MKYNNRPIVEINPLPSWALSDDERIDIVMNTVVIIGGVRYRYDTELETRLIEDAAKRIQDEIYRNQMKDIGII